ncbi:DUF3347 domain-containing protein [Algoriphagus aestuariicola]|uniref:DUF3347 domain-containing protein n=1 Tax=Algoriphagus aestuariicola TaxID=1852016 RepID=A0ABS3BQ91_9BACT|nr:DUF3347 domain-containing protein [Algoriphagus aestuariicola]MBN7800505.1 DUF3347 domain-containing protein [Algoriphagus aestuariicola]
MKKPLLFALALSFALISCGGKTEENHEGHDMEHSSGHETEATPTASSVNNPTTAMIDAYLAVKDALVADDQVAAASKSQALVTAIQGFEAAASVEELKGKALAEAQKLASGDIAAQRESFQALSIAMKDLLKVAGSDRTLYQQYCPMYKNNTGGMWLSASEDIKNPLFGSSMLTCGKVEETIAMN